MRRVVLGGVVALAAASSASSATSAPQLPGHVLLVNRPDLRVYSPALHASVACPHLLALPASALSTVKRTVELAMPPFERRLHLDGRDPVVKVLARGIGKFSWMLDTPYGPSSGTVIQVK